MQECEKINIKLHPVYLMIGISALILFVCSSLRHFLFQSVALDLGIFDQAVYLISQGQPPISSFLGFHILGDHGALILYPIALLYLIKPDVHWLLAVQAIALALGALPTWHLSRQAGLKEAQSITMATVYLLYPVVFNVNLFDFHPDVIALPAILAAVIAARLGRLVWFCVAVALILSCKGLLALTAIGMGIWLAVFEKRRLYGGIALFAGVAWFIIATQTIIPLFGNETAAVGRHLFRYSHLGNSLVGITQNLVLKPNLLLSAIFTQSNLEYLLWLLLPLIWGLSPRHLSPLVAATPALVMNILSNVDSQKNLTQHYSLPILPFLLLAVISTLASGGWWLRNSKGITIWSLIAFLVLAKFGYFGSIYLKDIDTWQATREAIALVPNQGGVLTSAVIAPHLTHRPLIKLAIEGSEWQDLAQFDHILLNTRNPGWGSSQELVKGLVTKVKQTPGFLLKYQKDGILLFQK